VAEPERGSNQGSLRSEGAEPMKVVIPFLATKCREDGARNIKG
jgi:hypothetical protein